MYAVRFLCSLFNVRNNFRTLKDNAAIYMLLLKRCFISLFFCVLFHFLGSIKTVWNIHLREFMWSIKSSKLELSFPHKGSENGIKIADLLDNAAFYSWFIYYCQWIKNTQFLQKKWHFLERKCFWLPQTFGEKVVKNYPLSSNTAMHRKTSRIWALKVLSWLLILSANKICKKSTSCFDSLFLLKKVECSFNFLSEA